MGRRGARFGRGEKIQERTKERVAAGICTNCGKNEPDGWRKMCRVCLDKRIEERRNNSLIAEKASCEVNNG